MRTSKDVDFTKVDFIVYAVDEYLKDIPIYEIAANYISLNRDTEKIYSGEFELEGSLCRILVNTNSNQCMINNEMLNAEELVQLFEGENVNPNEIIKRITGIDLDDYISEVTYKWGETEYLDVKGKKTLRGGWKKSIQRQ